MGRKSPILPGFLLIATGLILLLNRWDPFLFDRRSMIPLVILLFSAVLFVDGLRIKHSGRAFWGSVLLVCGAFFFVRNHRILPLFFFDEYWPILLIATGVGCFTLFIIRPSRWGLLIPSLLLLFFGIRFSLITFGLSRYGIDEWMDTYWPGLIILVGIIVLSLGQKQKD